MQSVYRCSHVCDPHVLPGPHADPHRENLQKHRQYQHCRPPSSAHHVVPHRRTHDKFASLLFLPVFLDSSVCMSTGHGHDQH